MNRFSLLLSLLFFIQTSFGAADHKQWLTYAHTDLQAAQIVTQSCPPLVGIALYHIEQAVEKALKAYLIAHHVSFALTHDLKPLLNSCYKEDAAFADFSDDIAIINPYATKSRYPNASYVAPSVEKVAALIARAETLLTYISQQLKSNY